MQIKVTIDNSNSRVIGLSDKHFNALRNKMAYSLPKTQQYWSSFKGGNKIYLLSKRGDFPTGLLYILMSFLKENDLFKDTEIKNIRVMPKALPELFELPRNAFGCIPYPEQCAAAEAARTFKRGIIVVPTGVGKSLIAALIIGAICVPTLLVVPSLELKRQLTESLTKIYGTKRVGDLGDGKLIAVTNVDSLDPNVALKGYGCVIIDEFHHSGAKTYRKLNKKAWANIFYKFGLTATPFRSQDEERLLLESVLSKVIYRMNYQEAVDKGYIVPMNAFYVEIPKREVQGYSWPEVYNELVVNNKDRNAVIAQLLNELEGQQLSTLCLVKEVSHGRNVQNLTGSNFINGADDASRAYLALFNDKKITSLIGTNGILGEGVDTKVADCVIIAGLGKSKNSFMQSVGRGFRVYPDKQHCSVIIFLDKSHKWTRAHFAAQVKILKEEYNVVPTKLVLTFG